RADLHSFPTRRSSDLLENANALPRHVAILGLPVGEDGAPPDADAVREWRDNLEEDYHVRPLFYPVRDDDHSALQLLLEAVADACGFAATPAPVALTPVVTASTSAHAFASKWFHEP